MKPSLFKIIRSDLLSLLCLLVPVVIVALALEDRYVGVLAWISSLARTSGGQAYTFFFNAAWLSAPICGCVFLVRLRVFYRCFADGELVPGKVTAVKLSLDRGIIRYQYAFQGNQFEGSNAVHKSSEVKRLGVGDDVDIIVNRHRPSRAFIKNLYA